jgi:hypothetical protein
MRSNKIYMQPSFLVALWLLLFFVSTTAILTTLILLAEIFQVKRYPEFGLWSIELILVLIFIASWILWRKATFSKKDFVKFARDHGIRLINKKTGISPRFYGKYRFAYGELNDIRVAAIVLSPFFSYFPGNASIDFVIPTQQEVPASLTSSRRNQTSWEKFQSYMFSGKKGGPMGQESEVVLYSLINGPYDIDVELKFEDGKGEIPMTNCPEIDAALKKHLAGISYYNARLIFNKNCLRMTIIGDSWEGRRFAEKIRKGFGMFQQMNNALETKYFVASWDKYQVKWNRSEEAFYLASQ